MYDKKIEQDISDKLNKLVEVNSDILTAKKIHHNDWMRATNRRFYVSFLTLQVMGVAFYVDVVLDGKESAFFNMVINWLGITGWFL